MITIRDRAMQYGRWWNYTSYINASWSTAALSRSTGEIHLFPLEPLEGTTETVDAGDRLEQSHKTYGRLRDKGVIHVSRKGVIDLTSATVDAGVTTQGCPSVKTSTGLYRPYDNLVMWGEDGKESQRTVLYSDRTISGKVYTHDPSYIRTEVRFRESGDAGICIHWITVGAIRQNGVVTTPAVYRSEYTTFRRDAGRLYKFSQAYSQTSWYSEAVLQSALLSVPSTGGTLCDDTYYVLRTVADPESFRDSLVTAIRNADSYVLYLDPDFDFGELSLECAEQLKLVDENILLLVLDVDDWRHFHKMWKNFANLKGWKYARKAFERIKRGRGRPKDIIEMFRPGSSTYLFTKYAVLPTVSDCERLIQGLHRLATGEWIQRLHSRRVLQMSDPGAVYSVYTATMTVEVGTFGKFLGGKIQELIANFKRLGLYPSVVNLWDMLPYSFVIDWFLPFGDLFEDVENYLYVKDYFPVEYVIMSEKRERGVDISLLVPGTPATGVVDFIHYHRWISRKIPLPRVHSLSLDPLGVFSHIVESAALIVQRR